jgi:hypothetical protein
MGKKKKATKLNNSVKNYYFCTSIFGNCPKNQRIKTNIHYGKEKSADCYAGNEALPY